MTLGEGGMGVVWLAEDALLQRYVAVKELRLPLGVDEADRPVLRDHLLREARAAARLNHPGATTVYDVVEERGDAYIVMELVRAPSLLQVVGERGPCDPALAARIGLALADALDAAHAVGIVHRDVKPGNVLITPDGGVKLTDFGIASIQGDPLLTTAGVVLGSPAYMAPEQARGDRVDATADVWSLAATLYFAVEGVPPFQRGRRVPTLSAVLEDDPRPTQRAGPLAPAIRAALVKDPARRVTLAELRSLLETPAASDSYGPVQTGPETDDGEPGSRGLRDAAGQAAKELIPVVSALLAQHQERYPALGRLRTALDSESRPEPRPLEPPPEPVAEQPASPRRTYLQEVGQRLRHLWLVAKLMLWALAIGIVALIAYAAYLLL